MMLVHAIPEKDTIRFGMGKLVEASGSSTIPLLYPVALTWILELEPVELVAYWIRCHQGRQICIVLVCTIAPESFMRNGPSNNDSGGDGGGKEAV